MGISGPACHFDNIVHHIDAGPHSRLDICADTVDDPDDNYVHGAVHVEYQRMLKHFLPGFVSSDHLQRINYGVVPYEWTCLFVN